MKVILCAFALLLSCSIVAADPFYVGLSAGMAEADDSINGVELDDSTAAGQIYLGWRPHRHLSMELSYTHIDDLESDDYLIESNGDIRYSTFTSDSIGLGLVLIPGIMTMQSSSGNLEIKPFATVGWHTWDVEEEIESDRFVVEDEDYDGDDLYYGLGIDIEATRGLYFRLEWRRLEYEDRAGDADVDVFWLGILEEFGFGSRD